MQYAAVTTRPLLSEDRQPRPFVIASQTGEATALPAFDLVLTSVLITPGMQMAILQPPDGSLSLRVRVGDSPDTQPSWRLTSLSSRSAIFEGPEGQRTLQLRVFDGTGGAAPGQPSVAGMVPAPAPPLPPSTSQALPGSPNATKAPASFGNANATASTGDAAATPNQPLTEDAQIEAIRQRIEARRAQLRQQAQPPAPASPSPPQPSQPVR